MTKLIRKNSMGTPSHIGYLKMSERDVRRHKSRCIYYIREENGCTDYFSRCIGSSHCKFYREYAKWCNNDIQNTMYISKEISKIATKRKNNVGTPKKLKRKLPKEKVFFIVSDDLYNDKLLTGEFSAYVSLNYISPRNKVSGEVNDYNLKFLSLGGMKFISNTIYEDYVAHVIMEQYNFIFIHNDKEEEKQIIKRIKKVCAERKQKTLAQKEARLKERIQKNNKITKSENISKREIINVVCNSLYNSLMNCSNRRCHGTLKPSKISISYGVQRIFSVDILKCHLCGRLYVKEKVFLKFSTRKNMKLFNYVFRFQGKYVKNVKNTNNKTYLVSFY